MVDQQVGNLMKWLNTLELKAAHGTVEDICDGVALAEALTQIAPEWFTPTWKSKIKNDVGTNWRLKVSNLKKIVEAIMEYYADNQSQQLCSEYIKPDAAKIGEFNDEKELKRLLQLVLGCAVNCLNKQHYITRIMEMEEVVQRAIMQSIQELEGSMQGGARLSLGASLNVDSIDVEDGGAKERLINELQIAVDARDQLAQRCHELDQQLSLLQEEKAGILRENKKMKERLDEFENPDEFGCSLKYSGLKKQVQMLKDEVFRIETQRDDYRHKLELLEKEILDLQSRQEDLQRSADRANLLKDEVDVLRETADKVTKYELTIESYKKKMEDMSDLKRQVKILEDKNMEYLRTKMELEEETKKTTMLRSHLEACKQQLAEVHRKLDEQCSKSDKLEFENKKLEANLSAVQRERDRLIIDRDTLKETNEELRCMQLNAVESTAKPSSDDVISDTEMIPPAIKEKLLLLQYENKMLKLNQNSVDEKIPSVEALLEDSEERINTFRKKNREANQKILELESRLEEIQGDGSKNDTTSLQLKIAHCEEELRREKEDKERLHTQIEEHVASLQVLQQKATTLQESLAKKEQEITALDERYKKYVEKAKSVIKVLDPKQNNSSPEINMLRSQNLEKRKIIEEMERRWKENKLLREMEEKMMITAFYRISATCHKEAVDQRLAALSAGQGQSFLSRQRQPSARKTYQPTYNSK